MRTSSSGYFDEYPSVLRCARTISECQGFISDNYSRAFENARSARAALNAAQSVGSLHRSVSVPSRVDRQCFVNEDARSLSSSDSRHKSITHTPRSYVTEVLPAVPPTILTSPQWSPFVPTVPKHASSLPAAPNTLPIVANVGARHRSLSARNRHDRQCFVNGDPRWLSSSGSRHQLIQPNEIERQSSFASWAPPSVQTSRSYVTDVLPPVPPTFSSSPSVQTVRKHASSLPAAPDNLPVVDSGLMGLPVQKALVPNPQYIEAPPASVPQLINFWSDNMQISSNGATKPSEVGFYETAARYHTPVRGYGSLIGSYEMAVGSYDTAARATEGSMRSNGVALEKDVNFIGSYDMAVGSYDTTARASFIGSYDMAVGSYDTATRASFIGSYEMAVGSYDTAARAIEGSMRSYRMPLEKETLPLAETGEDVGTPMEQRTTTLEALRKRSREEAPANMVQAQLQVIASESGATRTLVEESVERTRKDFTNALDRLRLELSPSKSTELFATFADGIVSSENLVTRQEIENLVTRQDLKDCVETIMEEVMKMTMQATPGDSDTSSVAMGAIGSLRSKSTSMDSEVHSDATALDSSNRINACVERIRLQHPVKRLCVLGGGLYGTDSEYLPPYIKAFAKALVEQSSSASLTVQIFSGGRPGVQQIFLESAAALRPPVVNLVPNGSKSQLPPHAVIYEAGSCEAEKVEIFSQIGDMYITFAGGPGVTKEATSAAARGATVIPMIFTGGASAQLSLPDIVTPEEAEILSNRQSSPDAVANVLIKIIERFVLVRTHSFTIDGLR